MSEIFGGGGFLRKCQSSDISSHDIIALLSQLSWESKGDIRIPNGEVWPEWNEETELYYSWAISCLWQRLAELRLISSWPGCVPVPCPVYAVVHRGTWGSRGGRSHSVTCGIPSVQCTGTGHAACTCRAGGPYTSSQCQGVSRVSPVLPGGPGPLGQCSDTLYTWHSYCTLP